MAKKCERQKQGDQAVFQVHMLSPILLPDVTAMPACSVSWWPLSVRPWPDSSAWRFSQYTALPSMGLKVTPSSSGRSQSTNRHQDSSSGGVRRGKLVPPPVQLARM